MFSKVAPKILLVIDVVCVIFIILYLANNEQYFYKTNYHCEIFSHHIIPFIYPNGTEYYQGYLSVIKGINKLDSTYYQPVNITCETPNCVVSILDNMYPIGTVLICHTLQRVPPKMDNTLYFVFLIVLLKCIAIYLFILYEFQLEKKCMYLPISAGKKHM